MRGRNVGFVLLQEFLLSLEQFDFLCEALRVPVNDTPNRCEDRPDATYYGSCDQNNLNNQRDSFIHCSEPPIGIDLRVSRWANDLMPCISRHSVSPGWTRQELFK